MNCAIPPNTEIVRIGQRLYDERGRSTVEPAENGRFVAIDIDMGDYEAAIAAGGGTEQAQGRG